MKNKKYKDYYELRVKAIEKRLVSVYYTFECDTLKDAEHILSLIKKSPETIDQLGYDETIDDEIIEYEVVDSYPRKESYVARKEYMNYYPFLKTENGIVVEQWGELSEKEILKILREYWEQLDDEEKDIQPWEDVKEDLVLEYFDEYGAKIVLQALK